MDIISFISISECNDVANSGNEDTRDWFEAQAKILQAGCSKRLINKMITFY